MPFAHLHVHTEYSFLDGMLRISDLVESAKQAGMTAVASTDRSNLYGAIEFQKRATSNGLKPIFGAEVLVASKDRGDPDDRNLHSMVLLAETDEGYQNLIALLSQAWLDGYHHDTPRVDRALLTEYKTGIIALSGGLGGDVSQAILRRDMEKAQEMAQQWLTVFGPEHYFLQVEETGFSEHETVNPALFQLGEDLGLSCVASNNCHYPTADDARSHAALMCIGLGKSYRAIEGAIPDGLWIKPEEVMRQAFPDNLEAVEQAGLIAERCNVTIKTGQTHLPQYAVPEGQTLEEFLRTTTQDGLHVRFEEMRQQGYEFDEPEYLARLTEELGIINEMGFPGYFLIVWDFIKKARELDVPVGPGRGSGAGSLVAWALRITDINPIQYGLLFERFLNPERVSMPDFDIDFCMNKRDRVIEYVTEKYGQHNVGQIITYGTMKAKAALRDVGRVLDMSFGEVDRIAKMIPAELGITLADALKQEKRIEELFREDSRYKDLYTLAQKLEGLHRHAGIHAAGLVISEEPLWQYVPICRGAGGEIVTQFAKDEVEEAGLVKFDFLGLKTLTVIDNAVRIINEGRNDRGEEPFSLHALPMDDSKVYELLTSGETTGVFQLESSGFRDLMKKLKPDCFEDVVAAVALYRPGPLGSGMVDDFVKRKHGETTVSYPHSALEETLEETYGVIVYQEQVMNIARIIAGYSLGQADLLRRAMGKKKPEVMKQQRTVFLEGAKTAALTDEKTAGEIFDLMAYFAGYGFNKSHSAAYAYISYQTAYLKAHYPVEFMAAILTADGDNQDKVARYIGDARAMGIVARAPDVNKSLKGFSVDDGGIRFGMGAIKNVGEGAVDSIIEGRADAAYETLFDFVSRVDLKRVNRRVLEALITSGACDCFGQERAVLFHNVPRALERAQSAARDKASGQTSLFALLDTQTENATEQSKDSYDFDAEPWTDRKRLSLEKDAIGFYVSGHPLDRFERELGRFVTATSDTVSRMENRTEVVLGGVMVAIRERPLRSGAGRMAFVTLEDLRGRVEVIFFSKSYVDAEEALKSGDAILVTGTVQLEGDDDAPSRKIRALKAQRISDVRRERTQRVGFRLNTDGVDGAQLQELLTICRSYPGACAVTLLVDLPGIGTAVVQPGDGLSIDPVDELMAATERLLGRDRVLLQ